MTALRRRLPDRPLAMGRTSDLPAMLAIFDCRECNADLISRAFGDGLEVKIAHDRDCPRSPWQRMNTAARTPGSGPSTTPSWPGLTSIWS